MKHPLISICIAVYNHGLYIQECLDSILKYEGDKNIEVIIINDASTDNTRQIIDHWIKKHPYIKTYFETNEQNLGQVKTISKAVLLSHGDYITFMDSDDYLIKSSLQNKLNYFLQNHELKVIYSNGVFLRNNIIGKKGFHNYLENILQQDIKSINKYLRSNTPLLSISCAIFKKDFFNYIGGFDTDGFSNDWVTNIKVFSHIKHKKEFMIDFEPIFAYRIHNNNISKNPELQYKLLMHVINKYSYDENAKSSLTRDALFVTALRYKIINDSISSKKYLNLLRKYGGHSKQYFTAFFINKLPYRWLQKIENISWNLKQYFKGRLF